MSHTLSLCMIVKNESKNLARCIGSAAGVVDEIIVVDTGSTDDTVQIARKLGAKIFHHTWEQNFSKARNYAISMATGSWVLLLDADEELEKADHDTLRELLKDDRIDGAHFTIHNYMGSKVSENCTLHNGFRLLRNNGEYEYQGAIHEQITRRDGAETTGKLPIVDIRVYHYGYMDNEATAKQKRGRNIPILEAELERNPEDPFVLFNLGNEYLAMKQHAAALELYNKSAQRMDARRAYVPHLIYRMITCCEHLGQYDNALALAAKGLVIYPSCTDYEYLRGGIYQKAHRYTLSIQSFERCLELGEPPPALRFVSGCGGHRAMLSLAELYFELADYQKAIAYFNKALHHKPTCCAVLYRIGAALNRLYADKQEVHNQLYRYFADPAYLPNVIIASDILLSQKILEPPVQAIEQGLSDPTYATDFQYLSAKLAFLKGDMEAALGLFKGILNGKEDLVSILPNIASESAKYAFAAALGQKQEAQGNTLQLVRKHCGSDCHKICLQLHYTRAGSNKLVLLPEQTGEKGLALMMDILGRLLQSGQYELFEQLLPALNQMESQKILLQLAALYETYGFGNLAAKNVLRSIKELDTIDRQGTEILWRTVR